MKKDKIELTEYAKNLIEEFGFIPMGGFILPDGRKSWEINYEESTDPDYIYQWEDYGLVSEELLILTIIEIM